MFKIILQILTLLTSILAIGNTKATGTPPADFINVQEIIPQAQTDIRYFTDHNFIGRKIKGYEAPVCLLTKKAANALKEVENQLLPMGLTLKFYDCYRPQTAVNDFADWATQLNNLKMRAEFYPNVDKQNLFRDGYIAYRSEHSRGSTVDLTIVPVSSKIHTYQPGQKLVSCTASKEERFPDNSLDFGTGYDCFSPKSHPDYQLLSAQTKANRLLLQSLMIQAGFKPLDTEWWHFSLINEPYPNTYFDFPVT